MNINQGDVVTISISAQAPFGGNGDSVLNDASLKLQSDNLRMVSKQVSTTPFMSSVEAFAGLVGPQFLATVQVQAQTDFNSEQDVADLVAHEVYKSGASFPTYSVTAVNGESTGLGAAGTPETGQSLSDIFESFFSGLSTAGTTLVIIVVGIVILVLVLIAYGPNIPGVARAATAAAVV